MLACSPPGSIARTIEQIVKYLLAFCVWLAGTYLLAITNEALFAIFPLPR
jgi:hypothetical protein